MAFLVQTFKDKTKDSIRHIFWSLYGITFANPSFPENPGSFLFVCNGNVCRSPFAEHLGVKMAQELNLKNKIFCSAGLKVRVSNPPPSLAIEVARQFGVEIGNHRSSRITREIVEASDVIVAMDSKQFRCLRQAYPDQKNRMVLLPLYDGDDIVNSSYYHKYNIEDPFGGSVEKFQKCFERIERCLRTVFEIILGQEGSMK